MREEIRRRDIKVFVRELLSFRTGFWLFAASGLFYLVWRDYWIWFAIGALMILVPYSYLRSIKKRFRNRRFLIIWERCQDRLHRFNDLNNVLRKSKAPTLSELPTTILNLSESIYMALRRADIVEAEVAASEGWMHHEAKFHNVVPRDPQAQELYRVAEQNIAEYKRHLDSVTLSIRRAEAQSEVYITTLDTLRIRMLGQRFAGKHAEMPSEELLEAVTEAKMQFDAIDKALDEIELTPYPKNLAYIPSAAEMEQEDIRGNLEFGLPPELPPDVQQQIEQNKLDQS